MRSILFLLVLTCITYHSNGQVGIGTDAPEATLDVIANPTLLTVADGIIAPRLSRTELTAKSAAYGVDQIGTIIYIDEVSGATNATTVGITSTGYYFYNGTDWQSFTPNNEQSKWSNNLTDNRIELQNTSNGTGRGIANAFYIEDSGNVGIGIDPNQKLSVDGVINTGGNLELNQLGTGNRSTVIDFHSATTSVDFNARIIRNPTENGVFQIQNNGTGNLVLDVAPVGGAGPPSLTIAGDDGFIGINRADPSQPLDVNGNGLFQTNVFVSGVPGDGERGLRIHKDLTDTAFFDVNSDAATFVGGNTAFNFRGDNTDGTTPLMRLNFNGDLTNQGLISTGGNLELGQQGTGNRDTLIDFHSSVTPGDNNARIIRVAGANTAFNFFNSGTGNLNFDTTNAAGTSMTIRGSNGFVGINRTAPTQRLDVNGNGLFSGSVTSSAGLLTSDVRLKKDIVPIENSIAVLQELNPVFYSKKLTIDSSNYDREEYGFIAQELQKVLPQLVEQTTREDQVLAVNYISLIPILTKAIQEQQQQLEVETSENEALKARVTALENEIELIKKALKL